ncbi:hypothetical protein [Thalassospira sp. TSL5-1]|uniref:hypothetical protein n=1 Tax=Thalassospira sp. TSL5-1 TaxID=1544451 RepID=UPI00093F5542|nr:hypothetical protein [Thalassospira sp. TSL5-1]
MIPQLPPAQATNAAIYASRLAPAGARGIASVTRSDGIEQPNERFGYQPDTDGTLFNAFIEEKNGHGTSQGGGQNEEQSRENASKGRVQKTAGTFRREGGQPADPEGIRFDELLDFEGPLDLGARRSPQSMYAMVNVVTHGGMPERGQYFDFQT